MTSGENKSKFSIYVVMNPIAGNASAEDIRQALQDGFTRERYEYEIYETTGKENVAELAREAVQRGFDLVIAAGGDGTVAGVVNGLVHSRVPLGVIPVGTGNGLARALHIPLDLEKAVELLAGEHSKMSLDAMQVGDRFFILNVSAGISARAMDKTEPEVKQRFGMVAYVWKIVSELVGFRPQVFNLWVDGDSYRVRATEILVSNVGLMENPPDPLGPPEQFNDGRLDIYIITAHRLFEYLQLIMQLFTRPDRRKKNLRQLTASKSLKIESVGKPQPTQGDGETLGFTPLEVQVIPDALQVVVPQTVDQQD